MTETSPAPLPRGAIACLALTAFAAGMTMRVNDALLPHLAREFGVPLGTAAQVVGLFAISYGLAQLFFGPVGDRYGKYRVIGWSAAACALAALACAAAPGFDALRAARVLSGLTTAAVIPLAMAWIGDVVPYEGRQPVLARFLIGQIVGVAAGVWLGGFAADHWHWRGAYVLIALLFVVASAVLLVLERRLPAQARATAAAGDGGIVRAVGEFAAVLRRRWARAILLLVFLEGLCLYGPFAFLAAHAHEVHGLSLAAAGAAVMLFGLGGFVFAVASARLVAAMGERGLALGGGVVMAAAMAAVAYGPAWAWVPAGCCALGLGFYMMHNTLQVHATQMAPDRRGAAVSAFAACFFMGQSAGVALGGALVGHIGTAHFLGLGALGLLAVSQAFGALLARRTKAAPQPVR